MRVFLILVTLVILFTGVHSSAQLLDLLPSPGDAPPAVQPGAMLYRYYLMSSGQAAGYKVQVEINGRKVTSIQRPEDAMEVTSYLHPGLNSVRFTATDQKRNSTSSLAALAITIGPEYKRQETGRVGQTQIDLRETTIHYIRPAGYRGSDSVTEMRFTIKDDPNPGKLTKKYVLYGDGIFTGHLVQVAINGIPVIDVVAPDFHCDLNPYLKTGDNEITFSSVRLDGFVLSGSEREQMGDAGLEVGVAEAGNFDPANFTEPVRQIMKSGPKFLQPGSSDQPEERETFTLVAQ